MGFVATSDAKDLVKKLPATLAADNDLEPGRDAVPPPSHHQSPRRHRLRHPHLTIKRPNKNVDDCLLTMFK
jgi:hypothetical protein